MLILPLALITALLSAVSHADPSPVIFGYGAVSCGEWIEGRKMDNYSAKEGWVLGYLSGLGVAGMKIKDVDNSAINYWLDAYCKEHPLARLQEASMELAIELSE